MHALYFTSVSFEHLKLEADPSTDRTVIQFPSKFDVFLGVTQPHYLGNGRSWKVGNRIFGIGDPDFL